MGVGRTMLRRVIQSAGYEVVRVAIPREREGAAGAGRGGGSGVSFFPSETDGTVYRPWPIPPDLRARSEPWAKVLLSLYARRASWPACVSPETGMFIHALVRNIRPRTVVETGTCHGASTIWIASAMHAAAASAGEPDSPGVVHTFDDFQPPHVDWLARMPLYRNREKKVRRRFRLSGFEKTIRVHVGDSSTELRKARGELDAAGGVQLAFIDGDHRPEGVLKDFEAVEPSLNVGGYILLHDVFPKLCNWTGPRWLADNIDQVGRGRYQVCDLYTAPMNYGLTVLRRIK